MTNDDLEATRPLSAPNYSDSALAYVAKYRYTELVKSIGDNYDHEKAAKIFMVRYQAMMRIAIGEAVDKASQELGYGVALSRMTHPDTHRLLSYRGVTEWAALQARQSYRARPCLSV